MVRRAGKASSGNSCGGSSAFTGGAGCARAVFSGDICGPGSRFGSGFLGGSRASARIVGSGGSARGSSGGGTSIGAGGGGAMRDFGCGERAGRGLGLATIGGAATADAAPGGTSC